MTGKELLAKQIDDVAYQLGKVLDGVNDTEADYKATTSSMSIRESLEHLCECYVAVDKMAAGENYEWGTFAIDDKSMDNLKTEFGSLRSKAVSAVLADTDKHMDLGSGYIVAHDNYHVGQLCTLRIAMNAEWDPYSIYPQ